LPVFRAAFFVQANAEDLTDPVRRQPPQSDLAAPLEDLVDRELAFEDEIPAILDLGDGIETGQVHSAAFLLGELRSQAERPVIELLADNGGAQPIGGCLQGRHIVHGQEGVVIFVETQSGALQFPLDKGVAA
jgi:hypothetical protein